MTLSSSAARCLPMISIMDKNKAEKPAGIRRPGHSRGDVSRGSLPQADKSTRRDTVIFCLGIIFIGCLIQLLGTVKGDALVFPDVLSILRTLLRLLAEPHTYRLIFTTLTHLFIALLCSTVIGVTIGIIEGMSDTARKFLKPLMILLRSIPMIVLVVIIMVLTQYSRVPYIAASLILVPLISEAAAEGCRRIDGELIDVYRLYSGFSPRILFSVYLPLMAGYLRQAYVNAVGMGIKIIVTTEYLVQTNNSLGKAVFSSSYFNEYEEIYAQALIMIALVLILSELPVLLAGKNGRRS